MAGTYAYHLYGAPEPAKYKLGIGMLPEGKEIGPFQIGNSYNYNVTGSYFNVTLAGFQNYTLTFSYNVTYGGIYNTTAHVYLQSNLSLTFKTNITGAAPGPIYIK